jgi:hypothetical protein
MDKKIAGLLGAAATLATVSGAHAAVPAQANEPGSPTSYRDLLNPVPNAVAALHADDKQLAAKRAAGETQTAQIIIRRRYYYHHHHHHHHHHRYYRYYRSW